MLRTGTTAELVERRAGARARRRLRLRPGRPSPSSRPTAIFEEELALLSAPGAASLAELLRQPDLRLIILRAGCSYRQRLEELLARRGIVGLRRLEFGTLEAILGAVAAGLGITLMPRALVGPTWRGGRIAVHRLPKVEARVQTLFVRRRDMLCSSALVAFQKHVGKGKHR